MKKKNLLFGVFCAVLSFNSFGQQQSLNSHEVHQKVSALTEINAQLSKINEKQQSIASSNNSRAINSNLVEELNLLNQELSLLLKQAIENEHDPETKTALQDELILLETKLNSKTN